MITLYTPTETGILSTKVDHSNQASLPHALWIDLLCPTQEEEALIQNLFQLNLPTKKDMQEIEPSSRLYSEHQTLYMTATMVAKSEHPEPKADAVSFILLSNQLITIRYIQPHSFELFILNLKRSSAKSALHLLVGLLESTTDRLADILEKVSHQFDEISHLIFHKNAQENTHEPVDYKKILRSIGINCVLGTKTRESLLTFLRLLSFLEQNCASQLDPALSTRITTLNKDISSLSDYATSISTEVNFLLDATLGMINIEQNNIIKIFSVAAVIFLPPTLIASIYGMNFAHMPELDWISGYPIALSLMILSAWLPYRYFRKKKWL